MSSSEFEFNDSDEDATDNHEKLFEATNNLNKVLRIQKHQRSELALVDSKYHLTKTKYENNDQTKAQETLKTLKKKAKEEPKVNTQDNVLPKPLEKPVAERIQRITGYENTRKELNKWNAVVANNRTAACVTFPLSRSSIKLTPSNEYVQRYRIKSDLEIHMASLKPKEESEEEDDKFQMTMEEAIEQQKEIAKLKAQERHKAVKARRQNKIKSKKFHRIQRKERMKKAMEEFEKLKETDPEAALKKLQELDNTRIKERMTLRHKNTGKWAQSQKIKAKYDKETRQVLAEQLAISRDLTQKVKEDDSDEDMDDVPPIPLSSSDKENPWMYPVKPDQEVTDLINKYRKYCGEINKNEKSNKSFQVSEICDSTKNSNSVEQLTKESPCSQNGVSEVNGDLGKTSSVEEQALKKKLKKNLQKKSKDKLNIKSPKSKAAKCQESKVKVGTSSWVVSNNSDAPIPKKEKKVQGKKKSFLLSAMKQNSDNVDDIDIDEIFDVMENKVQESLNKKLAKKKRELEKEEKKEEKRKKRRKSNNNVNELEKLGLKGQRIQRPSIQKPIEESTGLKPQENDSELANITNITEFNKKVTSQPNNAEIDPNKFINIKPKHVKTVIPNEISEAHDAIDDESEPEEDQQQIISEAFADDDVVDEFRQEKKNQIENSQPDNEDLTLPGWGSWGGKNIQIPSRKKKRFILKFPKAETRKDENKGDVVIIEEKNPKIKQHLVSDLPFPYTSVQDYEASLRAPIGREFVPEKTFSKLITPAVKTRMGAIIDPMSEDILVNIKSDLKKGKKLAKEKLKTVKSNMNSKPGKISKAGKPNIGKKAQNAIKA
ncbi:U3 small nucleolar RNA-associated protein 14 homolog A [Copidosoma floridanum]|uniref:U3 small nucleolar RNA-associated protein 14 homolog A n=1 Tax=Copidosoma floridanum TaxID=29053 RepID=UPI0006C977C5|nr:U3 small nucleolar RNA-associated protein 14 homolog A [Copidosoma floridanum]